MTERRFFNANHLKFIALFCMLVDHLYAALFPGQIWMTCIGRLAFPLFAFELAQGYIHTHNLRRYAGRLALLAVLSEVPYDMLAGGVFFSIWHQNVVWTLLFGLAACYCLDNLIKAPAVSRKLLYLLGLLASVGLPYVLMTDYGTGGVLMILLFWATRKGGAINYVVQVVGMFVLCQFVIGGRIIMIGDFQFQAQNFALLTLPLVWLYNGKHGTRNKAIQYIAYAFYPVHLFIFGAIFMIQIMGMAG